LASGAGQASEIRTAVPPVAKAKGLYRYQVLLRAPATQTMTRPLRKVIGQKPLPAGVSMAVDVDALNIM